MPCELHGLVNNPCLASLIASRNLIDGWLVFGLEELVGQEYFDGEGGRFSVDSSSWFSYYSLLVIENAIDGCLEDTE